MDSAGTAMRHDAQWALSDAAVSLRPSAASIVARSTCGHTE
jgi:hypothetical protein